MPEQQTRRRRVSIAVHTATQASSSHRTKTTKSEKGKKQRLIVIDDPKALPGASFLSLCIMCAHYAIMGFLFISGAYHNDYPAPAALFLIPAFTSGVVTFLGLLCYAVQRNKYISKIIEPTTGIVITVIGNAAGAAWCLIIYAPLRNDFTLAIQFTQTAVVLFIYFLLVRRRLAFASKAFSEGAHAVARVRAIFFRVVVHAVFLLAYTAGWSILYMRLIDVPPEEDDSNSTVPDPVALPKFISTVNQSTGLSVRMLQTLAKAYLIFNLFVISQSVKASIWMTVSEVATSVAVSAREGVPVVLRTGAQLNTRLAQSLPSVFLAGHFLLLSQLLRAIGEAFHRCRPHRRGFLHGTGALFLTILEPFIHRFSSHGLSRMERTGQNLMKSSQDARRKFFATGMHAVVNDDVLFGSRVCNYVLFAGLSSIFGSLLVEIFQYPPQTTLQIAMLCFVSAFCCGNWGMECAEAWVVTLYIEFAEAPETLYVSNPALAVQIHAVLFGCSHKVGEQRESANRKRVEEEGGDEEALPMTRHISQAAELALAKERSGWSGPDPAAGADGPSPAGGVSGVAGALSKAARVKMMSMHFANAPSVIRRYNPNAMAARHNDFAEFTQSRRHTLTTPSAGSPAASVRERRHTLDHPAAALEGEQPLDLPPDLDQDLVRPVTPTKGVDSEAEPRKTSLDETQGS